MAATSNGVGAEPASSEAQSNGSTAQPLVVKYPVNSAWEFTLNPGAESASGRVYCTDEISQIVVLQKALVHTTLASEIRMIHVSSILSAKALPDSEETLQVAPLSQPLAKIQKKVLEERERRAIRLAEDNFKHINQKVRTQYGHSHCGSYCEQSSLCVSRVEVSRVLTYCIASCLLLKNTGNTRGTSGL
jgi:hypothetical protein